MSENILDTSTSKSILVTNIQRFSLHDGPGIRTTIFLKGCSLRCPWCSNPENWESRPQPYIKDGAKGIYGFYMTLDELYVEIMKDKFFYDSEFTLEEFRVRCADDLSKLPGGVTFSGGECLLQIETLKPLLQKLKEAGVHTAIESSLFVPEINMQTALKYIDLFYVDIKILDKHLCKEVLQGDLDLFLCNVKQVIYSGKPIVFRVPVINGYTENESNRKSVIKFLRSFLCIDKPDMHNVNILKIELIKEHNLGINKYASLLAGGNNGYKIPDYQGVSDELMEQYVAEFEGIGVKVEICRI